MIKINTNDLVTSAGNPEPIRAINTVLRVSEIKGGYVIGKIVFPLDMLNMTLPLKWAIENTRKLSAWEINYLPPESRK